MNPSQKLEDCLKKFGDHYWAGREGVMSATTEKAIAEAKKQLLELLVESLPAEDDQDMNSEDTYYVGIAKGFNQCRDEVIEKLEELFK